MMRRLDAKAVEDAVSDVWNASELLRDCVTTCVLNDFINEDSKCIVWISSVLEWYVRNLC